MMAGVEDPRPGEKLKTPYKCLARDLGVVRDTERSTISKTLPPGVSSFDWAVVYRSKQYGKMLPGGL